MESSITLSAAPKVSSQPSRRRTYPSYPISRPNDTLQLEPLVDRRDFPDPINGIKLQPKWKQYRFYLLSFVISCIWILGVISLAFMSSATNPITVFAKPQTTISVINIGTSVSVFFLGELVSGAFDCLRWTLAARKTGFGLASFLGLSRATSNFGAWSLFFHDFKVGHRKWCLHRYCTPHCVLITRIIHTLISIALTVVLISNINFENKFVPDNKESYFVDWNSLPASFRTPYDGYEPTTSN